jgi:glycosyltransferase involved in cell wall biosynthesis
MKIIFLTQYFPPETGAPQNRLHATAQALMRKGAKVTVLTAMPNYPDMRIHAAYRRKWHVQEMLDGMVVHRAWLFVSARRSILWRLLNYFSFVFSSLWVGLFRLKRSDVLFVESPPLFLGITAMLLAKAKGAKLVFNVSDLWPESAVQLGLVTNRTVIGISTWLEELCYRRSALITGQTKGIVADIQRRCPNEQVLWLPNGVDLAAISEAEDGGDPQAARARLGIAPGDLVITYAGIIGHAQGLEVVLHAAKLLKHRSDIHFLLIGDGPEKAMLQRMKSELAVDAVRFVDRMPRAELLALLRATDAVVVPLRRNDLFKGAIPSKIFEALALSKPLLLGVEGEAKELFIDEGRSGLAFTPEDAQDLARCVERFVGDRAQLERMGASGARYVRERFDREVISGHLWIALQELHQNSKRA